MRCWLPILVAAGLTAGEAPSATAAGMAEPATAAAGIADPATTAVVADAAGSATAPLSASAGAVAPAAAAATAAALPLPWSGADEDEREAAAFLAGAPAWHLRAMGLLRLERWSGEEPDRRFQAALRDPAWQVRTFALLGCARRGLVPASTAIAAETAPHVLLAALRLGHAVPPAAITKAVRTLAQGKDADSQLLAAELAVASRDPALARQVMPAIDRLLRRIGDAEALMHGWRLRRILGLGPDQPPGSAEGPGAAWRAWVAGLKDFTLPPRDGALDHLVAATIPAMARLDSRRFHRTAWYLDGLARREVEIALCIDATGSMGGTIAEALEQMNRLMLVLGRFSQSLRASVVAYRDHGDRLVESMPLSADIQAVRAFLATLRAEGGGDEPESVLAAVEALMKGMKWSRTAARQIVVIGDAPDRPDERPRLIEAMRTLGRNGFTVHLVGVGGRMPFPDLAAAAEATGGRCVEKAAGDGLARLIVRLSLEDASAAVFDDFYDRFIALCL
jgi:hypothetical protein